MIKKISSKSINNNSNINYMLRYHDDNYVDGEVVIFDRVFNNTTLESEGTIKLWVHDIILKETGMNCKI